MSDEQTIYISPEDDLTNVRERLEQLTARRITLVIPSQTRLRSHVAWEVLHRRARDMGKKILVVSPDPQIRSVAHAAKFDVAHSLEAPGAARSRPASRPGRSGRAASNPASRPRRSQQAQQWPSEHIPPQVEPAGGTSSEVETTTAGPRTPPPSPFAGPRYEQPYDFRVNTMPPIQPLSQQQLEEEPDLLVEDFKQAQDIRQAAQRAGELRVAEEAPVMPHTPRERISMPLPDLSDDPFAYMADSQPPPSLREQQGAALVQDYDSSEFPALDIAERPTDVIEGEIEYQAGDRGDFASRPEAPPTPVPRSWAAPEPAGAPGQEDEDALPPIEERPTQEPLPASRPAAITGAKSSRPLQLPNAAPSRPRLARPAQRSVQPRPAASRAAIAGRRSATTRRRQNRGGYVAGLIVVLAALLVGALAYFGPTADVTITMLSRDYSHQVKLTTLTAGQRTTAPGSVLAETLTHTFSKSGTGTATSNTEVGNVIFTNNGSAPIDIPTGTLLATAAGVQFVTTADAVVPSPQSGSVGHTIEVPVRAQVAGASGHAGSGAITVIPAASLSAIAQANNVAPSSLKLTVTNSAPTTTGGSGGPAIITASDLDNAKKALHAQLQGAITAWVQHSLAPGDVQEHITSTDTLVNAPKAGQLVDQGTFPVTLRVSVAMQVVRSAALQAAAVAELNNFMSKDKTYAGYMIVSDAQHPLVIPQKQIKLSGAAPAFTLTFPATAKAVPILSSTQVQRLIAGKSIKEAQGILAGIRGVQKVAITSMPGFVPWVTFWTGHIYVHFVAGAPQTRPKV